MAFQRVIFIVLDSVGIGEMPDAAAYGDAGAHTLKHTAQATGGFHFKHLPRLGLGRIDALPGVPASSDPQAAYGKMAEASPAKDTTTGHWEMAGVISNDPHRTYTDTGFPPELIGEFERAIGRGTLGNIAASGTDIIRDLGDEHRNTGKPIVYTSADSVFQIAAHEDVIPIVEQYRICGIARKLCDDYRIGRVIARPFAGESGNYARTLHRRDYAMPAHEPTLLEHLQKHGVPVTGIGKIGDIFSERGVTKSHHTQSNAAGIDQLMLSLQEDSRGLIFVNLVDFDMLYGHRRDPIGYARALHEFDTALGPILDALRPDDLLMISADHGCDPTFRKTTDHTREYVPILAYGPAVRGGDLGTRSSFADAGATIGENFGVRLPVGRSFLRKILGEED